MSYSFDLTHAVQEVVGSLDGEFTAREVLAHLRKAYPELPRTAGAEVGARLSRLAEKKLIVRVKPGVGATPSVYRRT